MPNMQLLGPIILFVWKNLNGMEERIFFISFGETELVCHVTREERGRREVNGEIMREEGNYKGQWGEGRGGIKERREGKEGITGGGAATERALSPSHPVSPPPRRLAHSVDIIASLA